MRASSSPLGPPERRPWRIVRWWRRLYGQWRLADRRCPICGVIDCPSVEHAEEWQQITAW